MSYGAIFAEALALGVKIGIPPQTLKEVIAASRMGNGFFDTFMRYVVERDRDAHKFSIANAAKDLRYVNNLANEAKVLSLMGSAARQYYTQAEFDRPRRRLRAHAQRPRGVLGRRRHRSGGASRSSRRPQELTDLSLKRARGRRPFLS